MFKLNTDGTGFTVLHGFASLSCGSAGTNSDGANPQAELILSGNTLHGTAQNGGAFGNGTVFSLNTDGTTFTVLHAFAPTSSGSLGTNTDGANPYGGLLISGNTLYGTTFNGGAAGFGTVFSISLPIAPPQLTITPAGANVILTWPTNASGFSLQSSTNLLSPTWTTNLPAPVVVNGQYSVTNSISGTQQFFRLSQ